MTDDPNPDTPDPIEPEPEPANRGDVPEEVRADLAPAEPSCFVRSPMEDPNHPLHHLRDA